MASQSLRQALGAAPPPPARYRVYDQIDTPTWYQTRGTAPSAGPLSYHKARELKCAFTSLKSLSAPDKQSHVMTHTVADCALLPARARMGIIAPSASSLVESLQQLYAEIALDVDAVRQGVGRRLFFSEKGPTDALARTILFFDLDLVLTSCSAEPVDINDQQLTTALVDAVSSRIVRAVSEIYTGVPAPHLTCIAAACQLQTRGPTTYKFGLHLYWPQLLVTQSMHYAVRRQVVHALRQDAEVGGVGSVLAGPLSLSVPWSDVVDLAVIKARNLRMMGSDKLEYCNCASSAACSAAGHLAPPQPQQHQQQRAAKRYRGFLPLNPRKVYWPMRCFDATGVPDVLPADITMFEILRACSLCWPRDAAASPCSVGPDHLADQRAACGEVELDTTEEDQISWEPVPADIPDYWAVIEAARQYIRLRDADMRLPREDMDAALFDLSPNGALIGLIGRGKRRREVGYRLMFAEGRACPHKGQPHHSARAYYLISKDRTISIRCTCRRLETNDRPTLGRLTDGVRCGHFEHTVVNPGRMNLYGFAELMHDDARKQNEPDRLARLQSMARRRDPYVHAMAQAAQNRVHRQADRLTTWLTAYLERKGMRRDVLEAQRPANPLTRHLRQLTAGNMSMDAVLKDQAKRLDQFRVGTGGGGAEDARVHKRRRRDDDAASDE